MNKLLNFALIFITLFQSAYSKCGCNIDPIDNTQISEEFSVSTNDEIIDGVNYQKQIKIKNVIMLQKLVQANKGKLELGYECPKGYDAPDGDLLQAISQFATYQQLTESGVFQQDIYYISTTNVGEWEYMSMKLDSSTSEIVYDKVSNYWQYGNCFVPCIQQFPIEKDNINNYIDGLGKKDLTQCSQQTLTIKPNLNVVSHEWIKIDGTQSTDNSIDVVADTFENEHCGTIQLKLEKFGGVKQHFCHVYYTQPYINTADTSNSLTSFSGFTKVDGQTKAYRSDGLHFAPGSVPIAPKHGDGAYIMYADPDTMAISVKEIQNDNTIVATFDVGLKGKPFDIVSTNFGFVFMARDEPEFLYVAGYDTENESIKWKTTLINNGVEPTLTSPKDQIDLGRNNEGNPYFGTNAMYKPYNGRLINAREKIFVVFAHYNHFGLYEDGRRNDHTADSSVFLDTQTGKKANESFTWSSSHSLVQHVLYDREFIFTAALGDAYPQSIKNQSIEGFQSNDNDDIKIIGEQVIEPDFIPGNGGGKAAGRLGNLIEVGDNSYVQIHAQRPSTSTFGDGGSSTVNKLAMTFFNRDLEHVSETVLKPGNLVNTIKSVKYGDHIIIAYTTVPDPSESFLPASIKDTDTMNVLVVDFAGSIVQDFTVSEPSIISAVDDWEVLNDGSIIFSFVEKDSGDLQLYRLPALVDANASTIAAQCSADPIENTYVEPKPPAGPSGPSNETTTDNQNLLNIWFLQLVVLGITILL